MTCQTAEVEEETPGNSTWSEQLGLHPEDPAWKTATNLMICNLPARCFPVPKRV